MAQDSNVVIDHGKSQWSDLWKKEDYLAIWLGFIIIAVSILAYTSFGPKEEFAAKIQAANEIQAAEAAKAPFKTIAWYKAQDDKGKLKGTSTPFGKFATHWTKTPGAWTSNPLDALIRSEEQAKALLRAISFGGGCINDTLVHTSNPHLPFGGVGNSGLGSYHGKKSFDTFTHYKSVVYRGKADLPFRYPPFGEHKTNMLKQFLK